MRGAELPVSLSATEESFVREGEGGLGAIGDRMLRGESSMTPTPFSLC
jgi:hypothetical protein